MGPAKVIAFRGKYYFLSNFSPVVREGKEFSVEKRYQAFKARAAGLFQLAEWIERVETPQEAKRLGGKLNRPHNAVGFMEDLVREKARDPEVRKALMETGDAELIEGNHWHDTFWGVCDGNCGKDSFGVPRCAPARMCEPPHRPFGFNELGRIWMRVRDEVRAEEFFERR